jgi:hypothetical protein
MKNSDKPIYPLQDLGFPSDPSVIKEDALFGLTKREYFAAMAMQGLCANSVCYENTNDEELAKAAVINADALLNELEK